MRLPRALLAALMLAAVLAASPGSAHAQVFFGSQPRSELTVTPLFIVAGISPAAREVAVDVMFSVLIPPKRSALDLEQDLYLLWPGEVVASTPGASGITLPADVSAQVTVVREGRVRLEAKRNYESTEAGEVLEGGAPFITVVRIGGPLGTSPAATYIRIPWTPRLANQAWLTSVQFIATDLLKPKTTTWLGRLVSGPRSVLALGFNDVGAPAAFAMYYWQRDNVLIVASPARLVVNFPEADRLAVDTLIPPSARREPSPARAGTDVVSLFLTATEGLTPQVLRVEFGYFSRVQSWGPILIPALFFALGNGAGVLFRNLFETLYRRLATRFQFGRRRASASGVDTGPVIARERLTEIVPGESTYEDVLRICGPEVEEREGFGAPKRKTLVYRGRREVPHRRWAWSWLAAVDHWDVERHEVEIVLESGIVQDIQMRVGRTRSTAV
ncbi:MAG TPA: hypothetical protein VFW70_22925 [Methylomirabilota bacterium]|nr:hypothetical protein [Methylomirabilota bacterium]